MMRTYRAICGIAAGLWERGALQVLIVAGRDTTGNTLTLGLAALAEHPDFCDYMYRRPEKTLECCLELMRYIRSMVFAPGLHHCIGHLLAKMQVAEFREWTVYEQGWVDVSRMSRPPYGKAIERMLAASIRR